MQHAKIGVKVRTCLPHRGRGRGRSVARDGVVRFACRPGRHDVQARRYGRDSGRRGRDSGRAVEAALSRLPHLGGNGSRGDGAPRSKRSGKLGNTSTICCKCYVHPEVLNSYMDGNLVLELTSKVESELRSDVQSLKPEEAAVLALLRGRLAKEAERPVSKKQRANAA